MLGLRFCTRAFSSCGERGPLFIVVRGPLTIAASLVAEHKLQTRRISSCGSRAQLLRGMWDPPRPGLEPVFPALAGRFSTTAPPGKPKTAFLRYNSYALSFPLLKGTIQWVSLVYSQNSTSITAVNFGTFSPPQKETPYPLPVTHTLHAPSPESLATTNLSVSVDLPILDTAQKWYRIICELL